jgi:hypothetical protein
MLDLCSWTRISIVLAIMAYFR